MHGPDDIQVQLVFYSTFEPMVLPAGGSMEAMGVQKMYEPSPMPILYVGLAGVAADVLGRVPLMPLLKVWVLDRQVSSRKELRIYLP